jgi:hypothetical protein
MTAIPFTSGTAAATAAAPQADRGSSREAGVGPQQRESPAHRRWQAAGDRVETVLFASVQAVMLVCIVLVAAQLFATA